MTDASILLDHNQSKAIQQARKMADMDSKEIASVLDVRRDKITIWERGRGEIPLAALKTMLGIYYFRASQTSEIYHSNSLEPYYSDLWAEIEEPEG